MQRAEVVGAGGQGFPDKVEALVHAGNFTQFGDAGQ
jgi:hypothetical protein